MHAANVEGCACSAGDRCCWGGSMAEQRAPASGSCSWWCSSWEAPEGKQV